jgi:hypothetical protein
MAANNRVFYACQAVNLKPQNSTGSLYGNWLSPKGVQSVGMTTNFNLEQVFQLGQIDLYDQVEEIPNVEVTLNKIIDGTMPLYLMCMGGDTLNASGNTLVALANNRVNFRLGIFSDQNSAATGVVSHHVDCSGMYLSRFSYTFPVDGNATEDITLVGNNKVWNSGLNGGTPSSYGKNDFGFTGSGVSPSTIRRYNVNYSTTVLPTGTGGIPVPQGLARPHVQSVTITSDLGREAIREFGSFAPYYRYVNFPVEITSEFTVIATDDGDKVDANDFASVAGTCGTTYKNATDKAIKLAVCGQSGSDTLTLDLGNKNKLTSVNYTGGDTGGGNATMTYSFRTFNTFVMTASGTFASTDWVDAYDTAGILD